MVYRGKPSAGCENCRKAKKRCGLEQPSCQRCIKLKKVCSGYRDITQLQIQDESESVRQKAKRRRIRAPAGTASSVRIYHGLPTPSATGAPPSPPGEAFSPTPDPDMEMYLNEWQIPMQDAQPEPPPPPKEPEPESEPEPEPPSTALIVQEKALPPSLKQDPIQLATTYFFSQFTAKSGHWNYLRDQTRSIRIEPVLDLAIRACGMAALHNVQPVDKGREYARGMYAEAVGHVNAALRDPKRFKNDETLMAVTMLGYYENLVCDSRESVQSWKAHINGATQLLRIRGKPQLKSPVGRMLFREARAQILINCIWEDRPPPEFLTEWEEELTDLSPERYALRPSDRLTNLAYRFAKLRDAASKKLKSDRELVNDANQVEAEMIQWSMDTQNMKFFWSYREIAVPESPHVWNGTVHHYVGQPAATVWNTWRSLRIMLTRTQEVLCRRLGLDGEEEKRQRAYFLGVRRQMADDICGGIPTQLGHADPAPNSECPVITGYNSIWPIFFAATCSLERIGFDVWLELIKNGFAPSAASAQALWLLSRLEYISSNVGIKWADGVAATLRGDFRLYDRQLTIPEQTDLPVWLEQLGRTGHSPRTITSSLAGSPSSWSEESFRRTSLPGNGPLLVDRSYGNGSVIVGADRC